MSGETKLGVVSKWWEPGGCFGYYCASTPEDALKAQLSGVVT